MIKAIRTFLTLAALLPMLALAAESFQEGKHYIKLDTPVQTQVKGKVEVAEAFWYGCPHCLTLETYLVPWKNKLPEYTSFRKVPALFSRVWKTHGQLYFTLETLNVSQSVHDDVFVSVQKEGRRLTTQEDMTKFASEHGISPDTFNKTFKSFGVKNKMRQADKMIRGSRITGVPALIINGKYIVSASEAGSVENMFKVADFLIEKERKLLK